ncbi:hypothetical protein SAMD00019534_040170, partial [Acytostelium subglobosum LB1]|uniref:hypothetical protein n=1 Tax=Acytostelium subglobosum LB1 TaxID=1410327 RepID=UPI000644880C
MLCQQLLCQWELAWRHQWSSTHSCTLPECQWLLHLFTQWDQLSTQLVSPQPSTHQATWAAVPTHTHIITTVTSSTSVSSTKLLTTTMMMTIATCKLDLNQLLALGDLSLPTITTQQQSLYLLPIHPPSTGQ